MQYDRVRSAGPDQVLAEWAHRSQSASDWLAQLRGCRLELGSDETLLSSTRYMRMRATQRSELPSAEIPGLAKADRYGRGDLEDEDSLGVRITLCLYLLCVILSLAFVLAQLQILCQHVSLLCADARALAEIVRAPVCWGLARHVRSIESLERPLSHVGPYRQRSCFAVRDCELHRAHRAASDADALRFGRVISWIGLPKSHEPIRARVRLFRYHTLEAVVSSLRTALGDGVEDIWMPTHFVNIREASVLTLPVRLITRHAIIAPHVQESARKNGWAMCFPSCSQSNAVE